MSMPDHIVYLIDDEPQVRESVGDLLRSSRFNVVPLAAASDYLSLGTRPAVPACIILDIELPDLNGLEFQIEIAETDHPPIVFMTGHGDVESSVSAMKRGAVDFLTKPFKDEDLIAALHAAIQVDAQQRREKAQLRTLEERYLNLTPREREVLPLVIGGLLNKQVAAHLGISEVTVQIHRGRVMQKMQAASLADLVRMADKLRIPVTRSRYGGVS